MKIVSPQIGYDLAAQSYDDWKWQKFWHINEWPTISALIKHYGRYNHILDLGIGTGVYLEKLDKMFPDAQLCGVDISEKMIAVSKERTKANYVNASIDQLPFPDNSFDLILCCRVTSHLKHIDQFTKEVDRVLKENGIFVLTDVASDHEYTNTAVPTKNGKVTIKTFKHSPEAWRNAISATTLRCIIETFINKNTIVRPETYPDDDICGNIGVIRWFRKSENPLKIYVQTPD